MQRKRKDKSWTGLPSRAPRTRAQIKAARRPINPQRPDGRFAAPKLELVINLPQPDGPKVHARLLETVSSEARKGFPITSGVLDYFPDAVAAVAEVSFVGNQKHNPGEPLHWARGKSMDHADCIARHLVERGGFDGKCRHSASLAWRALALLQEELEAEMGLAAPRNARSI